MITDYYPAKPHAIVRDHDLAEIPTPFVIMA
jgi:hypothetical protein